MIDLSWRAVATILAAVTIYCGDVWLFAWAEAGAPSTCGQHYQPPTFGRT